MCYHQTQAILCKHWNARTGVSQILTSRGHSQGSATPWPRSPPSLRQWHYHWRDPMLCPVQALCVPPPEDGPGECALPKEITWHYCVLDNLFTSSLSSIWKSEINLSIFQILRKNCLSTKLKFVWVRKEKCTRWPKWWLLDYTRIAQKVTG